MIPANVEYNMTKKVVIVVTVLAVTLSGCTTLPAGQNGDSPESPSTQPTNDPLTPSGPSTVAPNNRLIITKYFDKTVYISMYEHTDGDIPDSNETRTPTGEKLASTTFGPNETGELRVTEFEIDGLIVISTDDGIKWQGLIQPPEQYQIQIDAQGNVTLEDIVFVE